MGLAALGVIGLVLDHGGLPWVSLCLAGSFGLYGLAHKLTTVRPVPGLLVETGVLAPAALLFIGLATDPGGGAMAHGTTAERWLLLGAGPVTAFPLLCFASAARRLPLASLGLFQYLAPTLALLLAVFLYGEPFTRAHAFAFGCIWLALTLYTSDRGPPDPISDGG
jgi:chloramphenicol-sensitive protein RarD